MPNIFGKSSEEKLMTVDFRLRQVARKALIISPIDFGISCGRRTLEEQKEAYRTKGSKRDGVILVSRHQVKKPDDLAEALDFYPYIHGKSNFEREPVAIVAGAFLQASILLRYPVYWGGLFKGFFDGPHIELLKMEIPDEI